MPIFRKSTEANEAPGSVQMTSMGAAASMLRPQISVGDTKESPEILKMMYLEPLKVSMKCGGMDYVIHGQGGQVVELFLQPGQKLMTSPGAMLYQSGNVVSNISTGGVTGMFKRQFAGEGAVMSEFRVDDSIGGVGNVCIRVGGWSGHLKAINLAEHGGSFKCRQGSFVAGVGNIEISARVHIGLGSAQSGMGNALQDIQGEGVVFIAVPAEHQEKTLNHGQEFKLSSGVLVGLSGTATYAASMNKGVGNVLMGGEGMFNTKITGPGMAIVSLGPQFPRAPGAAPVVAPPCCLCCALLCNSCKKQ